MRKQHNQGYEIYNAFKRSPIENDWYIVPIVIIGTLIAFTAFAGVENTFNVLAQFIGGVITGT